MIITIAVCIVSVVIAVVAVAAVGAYIMGKVDDE